MFKHLLVQQSHPQQWRVESAGTWAHEGLPAAPMAQYVLRRRGIDLSAHRSRNVYGELLLSFNLILVMEDGHKEALRVEFPQILGRVYLLSEMINLKRNIVDPMGGGLADFEGTVREFDSLFNRGMDTMTQMASREIGILPSAPTIPIQKK